jgi:hypothetical protein
MVQAPERSCHRRRSSASAHMADDLEAGSHVLQQFGDILAQLAQSTAAVGAGFMGGHVRVDLARKLPRQWTAEGLRGHERSMP